MNSHDEEFLKKLRAIFRIEAEEHLKIISEGLLKLEDNLSPESHQEIIEKIFREAHSLKGASRSVNHETIQEVCQALENVLSQLRHNSLTLTPELFDTLHATVDLIVSELAGESNPDKISKIISLLSSPSKVLDAQPVAKKALKPAELRQEPSEKTIRISLSKLDALFQEVEELLMIKLTAQQESSEIKNLLGKFSKIEKELTKFTSECQLLREDHLKEQELLKKMKSFLDKYPDSIKLLGAGLNKIMKASEQNAHFVGSMVDTLLEDVKKILMQPVSTLYEVLPRMVRDISRELDKEIKLEFNGDDIEVDRRILEDMKDPVIHIIRNAIDHGIESPEERRKKNKDSIGKIVISTRESRGSSVELTISDDGRGIDTETIKKIAVQKQMITQKEADNLSQEDAIKLAFQPGLSTSQIITEISGRGIGLGVVTEKIDKLGGHVNVESVPDKGTTFKLNLPLTMATFRGIHISVEGEDFIIPAHNVQRVIKINDGNIKSVENCEILTINDHTFSFLRLSDLLGIAKKETESKENLFALIVEAEEKTIAFGVNYIYQEHEVLLKSLGSQCTRVKYVMAATIMDWGKVIPILNPIDLIRSASKGKTIIVHSSEVHEGSSAKKNILLAEDSITTRLLIKNILEESGYEVKTAVDGVEALEILLSNSVDLLLTDVDMPRMDGFTLTEKIRSMATFKDLPIIICTGRGSKEDRARGIEIGANAYLDKSSFTQQSLVSITQKLL